MNVVNVLVSMVESESTTLAAAGMEALGHIGLRCPLPVLHRSSVSGTLLFISFLLLFYCK